MYDGLGILAVCGIGFFVGTILGIACGSIIAALI